jgi:hypothetical protein
MTTQRPSEVRPAPDRLRPAFLSDEDDLPHPIVDELLWSENYLSHAVFPETGCAHWLHQGRTAFDPRTWQDFFVFYLPDDRYLCAKGTARLPDDHGPQGPALIYRCDEPFTQWTKTFHGLARLVSGDQLRAGPLTDGLGVGVDMELTWTARGAAFDMDMSGQSWGHTHYEQNCELSGFIAFGDERIELAGTGLRDHSWGPRDFAPIDRHCWIHGQWADGRSFMIFHLLTMQGHVLSHVTVDDGQGRTSARIVSDAPLIDALEHGQDRYSLRFQTERGIVDIIAEPRQAATLSMAGTSEMVIGRDPEPTASHWLAEATTRFTWDGDEGWGLTERTVRRFR